MSPEQDSAPSAPNTATANPWTLTALIAGARRRPTDELAQRVLEGLAHLKVPMLDLEHFSPAPGPLTDLYVNAGALAERLLPERD